MDQGLHGEMSYMANHFEKRIDPTKLVPGTKSVITLLYNYYSREKQSDPEAPRISMYAYGQDYHRVIKRKLKHALEEIRQGIGDVQGRFFVDSAPVMEREWANLSGLGWVGRNTLIIHPQKGSYFFLAVLLLDLELDEDRPIKDYCGTCRKCIEACPTEAIYEKGYWLDASRCISYLTIELKSKIPEEFKGKMENWAFGCDICQDVCPWNRFSSPHEEEAFEPNPDLLNLSRDDWNEMEEDLFRDLFRKSAVKRTGYSGLQRNLKFIGESPN